jgi:hypothetical protein
MSKARSADGTAIAFDRVGEGPPVVLVGGAFQVRSDPKLVHLAELLAPHHAVLTYDRRGRGDSGDTAPYAVAREVEDLEAVISAAGGWASVFGMSSGAVLALEAGAHGLGIGRLALYDPPFMVDERGPRPPADHRAQLERLISAGRRGDAVEFFITKVIGMPAEAVAPMRLAPIWSELEEVAPTLVYDAAVMGDYSLPTERIASVAVTTLVVAGESGDPRLRRAARALWTVLPDVQHRTLEGQTHDVDPQALAPLLERFFAGWAQARRAARGASVG